MARSPSHKSKPSKSAVYWLYGTHAVEAALANSQRRIMRLCATANAAQRFGAAAIRPEIMDARNLESLLPTGAVHQGVAALVQPLEPLDLIDVVQDKKPLLMLDQVTDPHNIGAMLRSAAAFGAGAVITPKDHSAAESAVMAKAACGALDLVPLVPVVNLAAAIKEIKQAGYWVAGLSGDATESVSALPRYLPLCLVMGAEGKGMRRLTAEHCDILVRIPIHEQMESLNVSNAAAIALYAASPVNLTE